MNISKATMLTKDEVKALRASLQSAQVEIAGLKKENQALRSAINKLSQSKGKASVRRNNARSVITETQVKQGKSIRGAAGKIGQGFKQVQAKAFGEGKKLEKIRKESDKRKKLMANMTKEQRRLYHLNNLYIPQFLDRMNNYFGVASGFSGEQKTFLMKILPRFSKEDLEIIIRDNLGLEAIMYESEGQYDFTSINELLSANDIFDAIVDFAEERGILTVAELEYAHKLMSKYGFSKSEAEATAQKFHQAAENLEHDAEAISVQQALGKTKLVYLNQRTYRRATEYLKDEETGKVVVKRVRTMTRKKPRHRK